MVDDDAALGLEEFSRIEPEVVSANAHMARANPAFARFSSISVGAEGEPDRRNQHLA